MRLLIRWGAVLLLVGLLLSGSLVSAQKKKDLDKDVDKEKEKGTTTAKMVKAGQLVGKIVGVYESKKAIRLQVAYLVPKLNIGALNAYQQAQLRYQQALLKRDAGGARNAQVQMMQQQRNLYNYERKTKDYELTAIDDVVVRLSKPPEQFDEKGKVKRLTRKELKELKGDPKLPGYKAEFGDVQQDQMVQVNLVKKKDAPRPRPKKKKKGEDADEPDPLADHMPKVSMILILQQPPAK
jgi:hypothetical protein